MRGKNVYLVVISVILLLLISVPAYSKQKVLLVIFNGIKNNVYRITSNYLERKLFQVVISSSTAEIETDTGDTIFTSKLLKDIKSTDYKALIILNSPQETTKESMIFKVVTDMNSAGKIIGAIYDAPLILAEAGILSGRKATVWATGYKKLIEAGAIYQGTPMVIDGNIITASSYQALPAFLTKLMDMLTKEEKK